MSEDEIVNYSRQKNVQRLYVLTTFALIVIGAVLFYSNSSNFNTIVFVYMVMPIGVSCLTTLLGAGAKRAIDYKPGDWTKQKVWVSFAEYDEMVEKYEESYSHLFARRGESMFVCLVLVVPIIFGGLSMQYYLYWTPIFNYLIEGFLLLIILYLISSITGLVIGHRIPSIDAMEFFKPPLKGSVLSFARELEEVPGLRAGLDVELGLRAEVRTILSAEVKTYVEGLPDTAQVRVQVSHSGFAYPYLVGTIYKGHPVTTKKENKQLHTKYPPMFEYSMDEDVVVIVARFDIPSRTSSVPSISGKDFRALGALLAHVLKENYEKTQT